MSTNVICDKCGANVAPDDIVPHGGQNVCDDCAMTLMSPAKACDPWAVKMATGTFTTKAEAAATLQGVEKKLYDLVMETRRVPAEKLSELLGVAKKEIERAASTLRHMELTRGDKRPDNGVDIVPFDSEERAI